MSTSEHLAAAIAAMREIKSDDGKSAHTWLSVHGNQLAFELVSEMPGAQVRSHVNSNDDGTVERTRVASTRVGYVNVSAHGPNVELKVVDA